MKRTVQLLSRYFPWLLVLLGMDLFGVLFLWLADAQAFYALSAAIVLATIFLFLLLCGVLIYRERNKEQIFSDFLCEPDEYHEKLLLETVGAAQGAYILQLGQNLREKQLACTELQTQLTDYEEYVESWVHEAKTPFSLLTLLLDNHRDELSPIVSTELDYVRNRMKESIDQILFYARVKSSRKDYLFEHIRIRECIEDLLEDYRPLLDEKSFQIQLDLGDDTVYSDRRGLTFLLGQVIANSIKYCSAEPALRFSAFQKNNRYALRIMDNGIGVRSSDLPFIFEKGFTGNSGDRQKATGMGLYLAKEIAKELNIVLEANSEWGPKL